MDKNRYIEPHMETNGRKKRLYALCALLAFAGAACGVAYCNLKTEGSLYLQSDDGDLYLSIARNMLENAHFIQTARPIEAFVVPPGLPAMCTVLLFLFGGSGADLLGLLGFQYVVYGLAAAFMALAALRLALNGLGLSLRQAQGPKVVAEPVEAISADVPSTSSGTVGVALPWALSGAIGVLVPAFYVWCSIRIRHPNPGFILTENYVVCLIALILWLVVKGADVRKIVAVTFILTLFRPACSLLLIAAFAWMVICAFRNRYAKSKPPVRERVRFYDVFVMLAVFALVIGINIGVNYMETGEIIPLEDYSNLDIYLANNEKAGPEWYHSGKVPEFASTRYNQIILNEGLTRYRQNELAGEALREYVKANTGTVVRNACTRFVRLFCETWGVVFYAFLVCLVLQMFLKGLKWPRKAYILLMTVFLAVPPAFGLLVARYSATMLPLFIAMIVGTAGQAACIVATREKKAPVSTVPEPVEGRPPATLPDASTHFDKLNDRSASEPAEEIPEETIEEILEEPKEESVEIEEPEAEVPLSEAVKTMSAHELAAKLFPKKEPPKE